MRGEHEHLLNVAWHAAYNPFYWMTGEGDKADNCYTKKVRYDGRDAEITDLPVATDAAEIGIAFNPGTIRSVHQLHIHIVSALPTSGTNMF